MELDGFIDIHSGIDTEGCRRIGINILLNNLERTFDRNFPLFDFLLVAKSLKDIGGVSAKLFAELLKLSTSDSLPQHIQVYTFLQHIMHEVSIDKVYAALCTSGCDHLFPLCVLHEHKHKLCGIGKVMVPCNRYASKRYRFLKMCVDNHCFKDGAIQKLSSLRDKVLEKIREGGTPEECQKHLEEKVIIDLHLVQLHGVNDLQKRFEILQNMKDTSTQDLDRASLELTYHSKMAVTYAKLGRQLKSEEHIRQTLVMCERCVPCFATIMALNDVLYAYQELCFMNRSNELLNRAKSHGQLMYHVQCCEDEAAAYQWKRIILLFMIMTCLHISHEFKPGDVNKVSSGDVIQARVLISEVMKISNDIEIRRKMVLYLCQGRLHEQDDRSMAIAYVQKAYDLSNEGCIRNTEKINIEQYLAALRDSGD